MSNLFGPPPPPRPQILEPRYSDPEPEWYYPPPEPDPGRRRLAVITAFVGVALLVFANLATWLHFDGVHQNQKATVAAATLDDVKTAVAVPLTGALVSAIQQTATRTNTSGAIVLDPDNVDPAVVTEVRRAVNQALTSSAVASTWSDAVGVVLEQQELSFEGKPPQDGIGGVVVEIQPFLKTARADLVKSGYEIPADLSIAAYTVELDITSGSVTDTLGTLASLWWLLWLGAIGLIAASIVIATRRLRMGTIVCLDAIFMLGGCLLLVPLFREVADDQALNSDNQVIVQHAFDALTKSFVTQTVTLIVIAVVGATVLAVASRVARGREQRARAAA